MQTIPKHIEKLVFCKLGTQHLNQAEGRQQSSTCEYTGAIQPGSKTADTQRRFSEPSLCEAGEVALAARTGQPKTGMPRQPQNQLFSWFGYKEPIAKLHANEQSEESPQGQGAPKGRFFAGVEFVIGSTKLFFGKLNTQWTCALLLCTSSSICCADQTSPQVGFSVKGELLYWKAEEDNLEYAIKITEPRSNGNIGKGRFKSNNLNWNQGFRIAAGYRSHFDMWNVVGQWTCFHPEPSKSHVKTPDALLQPIYALWANGESRLNDTIAPGALSSSSKWDLSYDVLNLKLNREFWITNELSISPTLGVQSAWIDQHLHVKYNTFGADQIDLSYGMKNDYWGIGLQGGLGTRWRINPHLSIYGNGFGSLLWGFFKVKQDGSGTYVGIPNKSPLTRFKNSYHTIQGSLDLEIGIQWGFRCQQVEVILNAGWEQVIWFNQNQFITGLSTATVNTNVVHGDLGLSGFVGGLQLKW